jgi:ferredoxin-NADP reductase
MYRVVLYGLILILLVGLLFSVTGNVGISTLGLSINIAVLVVFSYLTNKIFTNYLKLTSNRESWLISALILACILPTSTQVSKIAFVAVAAVLAMASKYILTWKKTPMFNPAAFAALVLSITSLLPATWWIGSPALAPFTAIVGILILRKQRNFSLFFSFAIVSYLMFTLVSHYVGDLNLFTNIKTLILSWPLIFLSTIMLTEPSTLPPTRYLQILYAVIVGSIFTSQLHVGGVTSTPEIALILGNLFCLFVANRFADNLRLINKTQPARMIYELEFEKPRDFKFTAGQYMEWTVDHKNQDSRGNRRSFSISSAPGAKTIKIDFKYFDNSSTFKKALAELQPGHTIRAARPTGDFSLPSNKNKDLIFIAGGIGITPFVSMVEHVIQTRQKRSIELLYSADPSEHIHKDLFDSAKIYGVNTTYISRRLKDDDFALIIKKSNDPIVYLSGPVVMVDSYKKALLRQGLKRYQIKTDFFSGY